jgi:heme/copper-type cytochrome/quinol oxidase subunit 2
MENSEFMVVTRQRDISSSGVSWGAVIAGAFVAAALSLILLALGAGLGLSAVSPWSNIGASASQLGTVAIIWLILIQIIASAMGGYLAGRLRTRWQTIHNDEVHFRDTANGLVAWAVGVVITVSFLTTAATAMVGGTASANRTLADAVRSESAADANYLAGQGAARAGLTPYDAGKPLSQTTAEARQMEDNARKATAHFLLWMFIALLTGAFSASYAATIGGRQRDHVEAI